MYQKEMRLYYGYVDTACSATRKLEFLVRIPLNSSQAIFKIALGCEDANKIIQHVQCSHRKYQHKMCLMLNISCTMALQIMSSVYSVNLWIYDGVEIFFVVLKRSLAMMMTYNPRRTPHWFIFCQWSCVLVSCQQDLFTKNMAYPRFKVDKRMASKISDKLRVEISRWNSDRAVIVMYNLLHRYGEGFHLVSWVRYVFWNSAFEIRRIAYAT